MRGKRAFDLGLGVVLVVWIGVIVGILPCRGSDETVRHKWADNSFAADVHSSATELPAPVFPRKTKKPTAGSIVGRVVDASSDRNRAVAAGQPKKGEGWSAISNPFTLKPETTVHLYLCPTNGERRLLGTVKTDQSGRFTFKKVLPGNHYEVDAQAGMGVKVFRGKRTGVSVVVGQTTDVGDIDVFLSPPSELPSRHAASGETGSGKERRADFNPLERN